MKRTLDLSPRSYRCLYRPLVYDVLVRRWTVLAFVPLVMSKTKHGWIEPVSSQLSDQCAALKAEARQLVQCVTLLALPIALYQANTALKPRYLLGPEALTSPADPFEPMLFDNTGSNAKPSYHSVSAVNGLDRQAVSHAPLWALTVPIHLSPGMRPWAQSDAIQSTNREPLCNRACVTDRTQAHNEAILSASRDNRAHFWPWCWSWAPAALMNQEQALGVYRGWALTPQWWCFLIDRTFGQLSAATGLRTLVRVQLAPPLRAPLSKPPGWQDSLYKHCKAHALTIMNSGDRNDSVNTERARPQGGWRGLLASRWRGLLASRWRGLLASLWSACNGLCLLLGLGADGLAPLVALGCGVLIWEMVCLPPLQFSLRNSWRELDSLSYPDWDRQLWFFYHLDRIHDTEKESLSFQRKGSSTFTFTAHRFNIRAWLITHSLMRQPHDDPWEEQEQEQEDQEEEEEYQHEHEQDEQQKQEQEKKRMLAEELLNLTALTGYLDSIEHERRYLFLRSILNDRAIQRIKHNEQVTQVRARHNETAIQGSGLRALCQSIQNHFDHPASRWHHGGDRSLSIFSSWLGCASASGTALNESDCSLPPPNLSKPRARGQARAGYGLTQQHQAERSACLPSHLVRTGSVLFVGAVRAGKTYLASSLSAQRGIPLVRIDIRGAISPRSEALTELFERETMSVANPSRRARLRDPSMIQSTYDLPNLPQLWLLFNLAKRLGPCVVWVPDLHTGTDVVMAREWAVPPVLQNLLYTVSNDQFRRWQQRQGGVLVASTPDVMRTDPSFLHPERLGHLMHVRMLNHIQRQRSLHILLHTKRLQPVKHMAWGEIGNRSAGYHWRDIVELSNEAHLIAITRRTCAVDTSLFQGALDCQGLMATRNTAMSHLSQSDRAMPKPSLFAQASYRVWLIGQGEEMVCYRLGRAVAQSMFVKLSTPAALPSYPRTSRDRLHYLFKRCLPSLLFEPNVTEFTVIPYILSCLAGSAARDAWLVYESSFDEHILEGGPEATHDLELASGLFGNLFGQVAHPDMYAQSIGGIRTTRGTQIARARERQDWLPAFGFGSPGDLLSPPCSNEGTHSNAYDSQTLSLSHSFSLPSSSVCLDSAGEAVKLYRDHKPRRVDVCRSVLFQARGAADGLVMPADKLLWQFLGSLYGRNMSVSFRATLKPAWVKTRALVSNPKRRKNHLPLMGQCMGVVEHGTSVHPILAVYGRPVTECEHLYGAQCTQYDDQRLFMTQHMWAALMVLNTQLQLCTPPKKRIRTRYDLSIQASNHLNSLMSMPLMPEYQAKSWSTREWQSRAFQTIAASQPLSTAQLLVHSGSKRIRPLSGFEPFEADRHSLFEDEDFVRRPGSEATANLSCSQQQQHMAWIEQLVYGALVESYDYLLRLFLSQGGAFLQASASAVNPSGAISGKT